MSEHCWTNEGMLVSEAEPAAKASEIHNFPIGTFQGFLFSRRVLVFFCESYSPLLHQSHCQETAHPVHPQLQPHFKFPLVHTTLITSHSINSSIVGCPQLLQPSIAKICTPFRTLSLTPLINASFKSGIQFKP